PTALQLAGAPGSSQDGQRSVLPRPAGLTTRGSAEDLAKEEEELKKLRRSGKGGLAKQIQAKLKIVADKKKEIDGLKEQLAEKPNKMSAPLCNGYTAELELHREALEKAVGELQAWLIALQDDAIENNVDAQQQRMDELAEAVKEYAASALTIKKPFTCAVEAQSADLVVCFRLAILPYRLGSTCPEGSGNTLGPLSRHVLKCTGKGDLSFAGAVRMLQKGAEAWAHWVTGFDMLGLMASGLPTLNGKLPVILPHELLHYLHANGMLGDALDGEEVVASLNAAMLGFFPERPILGDDGSYELPDCTPQCSATPLVTANANVVRFPVTELRADWKFYKVPGVILILVHMYMREDMLPANSLSPYPHPGQGQRASQSFPSLPVVLLDLIALPGAAQAIFSCLSGCGMWD
ncbi:unnamed protein product, partial [Symbiodinium pilosum]